MKDNDQSIMININSLYLTLEKSLTDYIEEKVCYLPKLIHLNRYTKECEKN